MPDLDAIFWRRVTVADFASIEHGPRHDPDGGGGQGYFSISFAEHLDHEEFGRFLGVDPPSRILTERPDVDVDAGVLGDPRAAATLRFRRRYRLPQPGDRYRIATQNRQKPTHERHPAWTARRGFPAAPDDVTGSDDPRIPDLSQLKILVARDVEGAHHAGFVNSGTRPPGLPASLAPLFVPNADSPPNGLIWLSPGALSAEDLAAALHGPPTSPEIEDALDATARAAGGRPRRQGYRQSAEERRAIELYAMAQAVEHLTALGWTRIEDVSADHPYDLRCRRADARLEVEVKGTTGDGGAVLLTPNEVVSARRSHPRAALLIVSDVVLGHDAQGGHVASGGRVTLLDPWDVDADGTLEPTGYRYVRRPGG